jgi:hypothetical protein
MLNASFGSQSIICPLFFTKKTINSSSVLFFLAVSNKYMVSTKKFCLGILSPTLNSLETMRIDPYQPKTYEINQLKTFLFSLSRHISCFCKIAGCSHHVIIP